MLLKRNGLKEQSRHSETAQPGNRRLALGQKTSSDQVMLEIVKNQSNAIRKLDTQGGKRSPTMVGQDTTTRTSAAMSGDFDQLAVAKQTTSTISQSRQDSMRRGQNERFKNSPLISMNKYPNHVLKQLSTSKEPESGAFKGFNNSSYFARVYQDSSLNSSANKMYRNLNINHTPDKIWVQTQIEGNRLHT